MKEKERIDISLKLQIKANEEFNLQIATLETIRAACHQNLVGHLAFRKLTSAQIAIFHGMVAFLNQNSVQFEHAQACFGVLDLAARTKFSKRSCVTALQDLSRLGVIRVAIRSMKATMTNAYDLLIPIRSGHQISFDPVAAGASSCSEVDPERMDPPARASDIATDEPAGAGEEPDCTHRDECVKLLTDAGADPGGAETAAADCQYDRNIILAAIAKAKRIRAANKMRKTFGALLVFQCGALFQKRSRDAKIKSDQAIVAANQAEARRRQAETQQAFALRADSLFRSVDAEPDHSRNAAQSVMREAEAPATPVRHRGLIMRTDLEILQAKQKRTTELFERVSRMSPEEMEALRLRTIPHLSAEQLKTLERRQIDGGIWRAFFVAQLEREAAALEPQEVP